MYTLTSTSIDWSAVVLLVLLVLLIHPFYGSVTCLLSLVVVGFSVDLLSTPGPWSYEKDLVYLLSFRQVSKPPGPLTRYVFPNTGGSRERSLTQVSSRSV